MKKVNKENAIDLISTNDVIELKELFNTKYRANIQDEFVVELIDKKGIDTVKECVEVFDQYVKNASEVEKIFYDFTLKYGTDKAYTKTTGYRQKPVQSTNYEQRKYDDEFFDSICDNAQYIKHNKKKPIQSMNYEQRKYDDDFFDSLYDNINLIKEIKKESK